MNESKPSKHDSTSPSAPPARKTAQDFSPDVLRLFDSYVHGIIDRRGFLERATKFATGTTAIALLEALNPRFAEAAQVSATDARIHAEYVEIPSPDGYGKVRGYLVRPSKPGGKLPAVLVVHENRGLNPHIEDIARRLALDHFLAFAPDALFPLGGYPGDEDKARELFAKLDQAKTRQDFVASANWLEHHPEGNGRLGVVGFCYGGGVAHFLATKLPTLKAAVPFYGMAPPASDAKLVKAQLLVNLAEHDDRINSAWPEYEAALKAAHVHFEVFRYPGTQHGFNNDTTPRYDEAAAKLAWSRTLALFEKTLRTPGSAPAAAQKT
ncbi:MAG TPA: dienelactone hydrolase family protein [Polyangiaceae bacterium]|nr:dienelactone hydrolase family protein [Polyangiaceae bacterium]